MRTVRIYVSAPAVACAVVSAGSMQLGSRIVKLAAVAEFLMIHSGRPKAWGATP